MPEKDDAPLAFHVRGLTKTYGAGESKVYALRGVDLDVPRGELVVLLGQSGSGKSTLLNILGGLDSPSEGQVFFNGEELTAFNDRHLTAYRRQHVGFVSQFYNLIPSLTARENVTLVTEIAEQAMAAEEALQLVGLGERMDHFPAQLSGGEQQRVAIARAIAKQPRVLLCDEPTGALDSKTGNEVMALFDELHAQGLTIIMVTHEPHVAQHAQRIITLMDGKIVADERDGRKLEAIRLVSEVNYEAA